MLLGAIVFGGLAVFSASRYITQTVQREKNRLNPNVEQQDVVVAKSSLKRGELVGSDNMAVRKIPKDYVPGTAVDPAEFGNVEGAKLAVDMRQGEVLLRGTLEGADTTTFSTRVEPDARAITLMVDEINSIAGLLQPNDHVDLFYTAKPTKKGNSNGVPGPDQNRLLMQNVIILATGRQVRPSVSGGNATGVGRAFTTITIEALPLDVQRLILAQKGGTLTAVLRGNKDAKPLEANTMTAAELFGPGAHAKGRGETTEIIIGGKGGGRADREIMQFLGADRAAIGGSEAPPATTRRSSVDVLNEYLRANQTPAEPITMSH
jgi:pilus assembly protein CpaB